MRASSIAIRIVLALLALALLAVSAGMAWAATADYRVRGYVAHGVTVAGNDLGGMTEEEARRAIEQAVAAPLLEPVAVEADGRTFEFDPRGAVAVDVDAMLADAFAPRRSASFLTRLRHDLIGAELPHEVTPLYSVDTTEVARWVGSIAKKINRAPRDATATVEGVRVVITPSVKGRKLSTKQSTEALVEVLSAKTALAGGGRSVTAPVSKLKPKVTEKRYTQTILVDLSERRIRLFADGKLEKSYPCAVGTPSFPTPAGEFEVELKRYLPTWVNPGSDWAKDMPDFIPPGPGNPLGTRAINLSAPGIRFHGTENIRSVGTAASHGCMRMYRADIEDLYDRVQVGTKVFIVP